MQERETERKKQEYDSGRDVGGSGYYLDKETERGSERKRVLCDRVRKESEGRREC